MQRYIHKYHTPIKVMVNGVVENWYYAPHYEPRLLPVVPPRNDLDSATISPQSRGRLEE